MEWHSQYLGAIRFRRRRQSQQRRQFGGSCLNFSPTNWTGRVLRKLGTEILRRGGMQGVWVDVGAHHGETTIGYALHNPGLMIYAIEPNLRAAVRMVGHAPNFIVIPMAVAETDGC